MSEQRPAPILPPGAGDALRQAVARLGRAARSVMSPDVGEAPGDDLDDRGPRELTRRAFVGLVAAGVVAGWLVNGSDGAMVAPAVIVAAWTWRSAGSRPIALVAAALLAAAAVATVVEVTPSRQRIIVGFARQRPVAAAMAAMAGTLWVVAVLVAGYVERAHRPAAVRPLAEWPAGLTRLWERRVDGWSAVRDDAQGRARELVGARSAWFRAGVWAALGTVAAAIRLAVGPSSVPADVAAIVANLRYGTTYGSRPFWDGPTADVAPLTPVLLAFGPFGTRLLLVLAGVVTAGIAARLAGRQVGRSGARWTFAVAAVFPPLWDQPLPMVLGGLCVVGAVGLADPDRLDGRRAALAGVAAAMASLAAPDAVVALPVLAFWVLRRGDVTRRKAVAALTASWALVLIPWWAHVGRAGPVPGPAPGWSAFVGEGLTTPSLPLLASVVSGALVAGLWTRCMVGVRDEWVALAPYVLLPIWSVAMAMAAGGDRDVFGWAAPLVVVVLGVALSGWWDRVPHRRSVATPKDREQLFA
jgi:hypothetical protein